MFYETKKMSGTAMTRFITLFDKHIGTEREINEIDVGLYYIFCVELTHDEVIICRDIEHQIGKGD